MYNSIKISYRDNFLICLYGFHDFNFGMARAELELRYRGKNDPDKPPRRKPGDIYIVIGAVIGMILGGILGGLISFRYLNLFCAALCTIGGLVIGGLLGTMIGSAFKKWRNTKRRREG